MKNLMEKMMNEYYTKYPKNIEIPEDYWESTHNVEYEVIEG